MVLRSPQAPPALCCPEAGASEVPELCWRADIIITVATPIDQAATDKAFKLKLITVAGDSYGHIDLEAAHKRGIKVCNVPGLDPQEAGDSDQICNQVIENINACLRGREKSG